MTSNAKYTIYNYRQLFFRIFLVTNTHWWVDCIGHGATSFGILKHFEAQSYSIGTELNEGQLFGDNLLKPHIFSVNYKFYIINNDNTDLFEDTDQVN